jgi:hypothetical protein
MKFQSGGCVASPLAAGVQAVADRRRPASSRRRGFGSESLQLSRDRLLELAPRSRLRTLASLTGALGQQRSSLELAAPIE